MFVLFAALAGSDAHCCVEFLEGTDYGFEFRLGGGAGEGVVCLGLGGHVCGWGLRGGEEGLLGLVFNLVFGLDSEGERTAEG